MNFLNHIETNAINYPNTVAIQLNNTKITYAELYQGMVNVATTAEHYGVAGGNILFACKPDPESLTVALGLLLAGSTLTILDPFTSDTLFINRGTKAQITHVLGDNILYHVSKHRKIVSKLMGKPVADILSLGVPTYSLGKYGKYPDVRKWVNTPAVVKTFPVDENHAAIIVFTSGTTSEPKGVVHTLKSLSANIEPFSELFGMSAGKIVYSEPMTLGLIALSAGSTWIIPGKEKTIPNCDVWFGTPMEILEGLPKTVNSVIKTVGSGSAPVLPSLVNKVKQAHPDIKFLCVYGMTEMLPIAVGDAMLKETYIEEGDYIGPPLPTNNVTIVDGEVMVSGDGLMRNYLGHPEATTLPTGDFGKLLPTGELILLGRKKNMFIRGDMNVYPGLYEPGLSTLTGVNEVVLTGLPDQYGDDELILAVTVNPGADKKTVKEHVENNMYKFFDVKAVPSCVVVLDAIPKNGRANKIDRDATQKIVKQLRNEGKI